MKKFFLILTAMFFAFCLNATVYYVSLDGTGADGATWSTAYQTIDAALAVTTSGDEIWVKQGTYTLAAPLSMVAGVNVYGGFAGTETVLTTRSKDASLTVIDGSGSSRILSGVTATVETIWDGFTLCNGKNTHGAGAYLRAFNTLHNCVVTDCNSLTSDGSYGAQGCGVFMTCGDDNPAKLVACTIKDNKLTTVQTSSRIVGGAGVYVEAGSYAAIIDSCVIDNNIIEAQTASSNISGTGAGVLLYSGNISNSKITNNTVTTTVTQGTVYRLTGAGIHIVPKNVSDDEGIVKVTNCTITGNSSETSRGGGILIDPYWGDQSQASGVYTFTNCVISDNYSQNVGGACIITNNATIEKGYGFTTNFNNCVFANNSSVGTGSAVFVNTDSVTLNMTNCSVVRNYGQASYAGQLRLNKAGSTYNLTNCLIWGNKCNSPVSTDNQLHIQSGATATVTNCAIENASNANYSEATVTDVISLSADNNGSETGVNYPCFVNPATTSGVDGYGDYDWSLSNTSDCIDAGTSVSLITDIEGNTRPTAGVEGGTALFDIGAYEFVPDISTGINGSDNKVESSLKVYSGKGYMTIVAEEDVNVEVYGLQGNLINRTMISLGENRLSVKAGLYVVRIGNQASKVIVY